MKIGICGDVHLSNNIRCRTDDFLETALNKLEFIANENDKVIILGDLVHVCSNNDYLFNKVYKIFKKHEGKFLSIPGNHDVFHNNLNKIDSITIGSLNATGVLDIKTEPFELYGINFVVSSVIKNIKKLPVDKENKSILLGHNYFNFSTAPDESFTEKEIEKLNYNLVFLGHDHKPYEDLIIGNSILIRMGSLTRIDTQTYNKNRKIYYYQVDSDTMEYVPREVPSLPVNECFIAEAFNKTYTKDKLDYSGLKALLKKFDKQFDTELCLSEILKGLNASERQIAYIKSIHTNNNMGFK